MISLRPALSVTEDQEIRCFLSDAVMTKSDLKEFAANDNYEAGQANYSEGRAIFDDVVTKSNFIQSFRQLTGHLKLTGCECILEMGSSHGWACVLLKEMFPGCYLVASDLVPDCVKHALKYELLLGVSIDEKWAFNCRDIPFQDAQFDVVFTFAAFHHFGVDGNFEKALVEMLRIVKPGGRMVFLYEPSSSRFLYKSALRRVNLKRKHEGVDEDIVVCDDIRKIVERLGCAFKATPYPIALYRDSAQSTIYYFLLSKLRFLQRHVVCTTNIEITKPLNGLL